MFGGMTAAPIVVVSPHRDDAVMSCWSVLSGPCQVTVVNVFTGAPAAGVLAHWDRGPGVADSAARVRQRALEDRSALASAGRAPLDLGLVEAVHGGGRPLLDEVLWPYLADAEAVYVTAGVALFEHQVNLEHGLVRDTVLALRPDARLYADQPYCGFRGDLELPPALAAGRVGWRSDLSTAQRTAKAEAIRCYAGEVPKLERVFGRFAAPDCLSHEVFWAPV